MAMREAGVVGAAAGVESYYRSAMNAMINLALTGTRGKFFESMRYQVPTRMFYIYGLKKTRQELGSRFGQNSLVAALGPGIIMCPPSSVLEACNAKHRNSEPLRIRWTRGVTARLGREVIFGLGLNQMSDVVTGLVPLPDRATRVAVGSLSSGLLSGFLSQPFHNLSTLRLMSPKTSYGDIIRNMGHRVLWGGSFWRSLQIAGSFVLINGGIVVFNSVLDRVEARRKSSSP